MLTPNSNRQLAGHLSQRDSETNIEAAIASRDLAKAASEDSSAMKSIAVLAMFFLPGTFFSALFALPSWGWDQHRHFSQYWAFTVPATILTFAIWVALTQRAVCAAVGEDSVVELALEILARKRRRGWR